MILRYIQSLCAFIDSFYSGWGGGRRHTIQSFWSVFIVFRMQNLREDSLNCPHYWKRWLSILLLVESMAGRKANRWWLIDDEAYPIQLKRHEKNPFYCVRRKKVNHLVPGRISTNEQC